MYFYCAILLVIYLFIILLVIFYLLESHLLTSILSNLFAVIWCNTGVSDIRQCQKKKA